MPAFELNVEFHKSVFQLHISHIVWIKIPQDEEED